MSTSEKLHFWVLVGSAMLTNVVCAVFRGCLQFTSGRRPWDDDPKVEGGGGRGAILCHEGVTETTMLFMKAMSKKRGHTSYTPLVGMKWGAERGIQPKPRQTQSRKHLKGSVGPEPSRVNIESVMQART